MIDDGNKRFYRRCDEFAICVNLGKKGYVTAESPEDRNTIFQYIVYGKGKAGIMFTEDNIEFKDRELVDLRRYVHEYVMSIATEDFFIIGFNTYDKYQKWDAWLISDKETELDLRSYYDKVEPFTGRTFIICLDGKPIVNGKSLKRYDYSEVFFGNSYKIDLNGGVLGLFVRC